MTILPPVMPEEFVLGYWGRIHILNLLGTPNQTAEALIDYFALPPSRIQRVEALALAAKTDVQTFVQNHTLLPAHAAITVEFCGIHHGNSKFENLIKKSWKVAQKPGAYFCPECASDQRAREGFSYWQRCHQLLGVNWCAEHGEALLRCPESAFINETPRMSLATNATPRKAEPDKPYSLVLERYAKIMYAFLTRTVRADMRHVSRTLRLKAVEKSIATDNTPGYQFLSDIAVSKLPDWWLKELFPSIHTKRLGVPFYPIDNAVLRRRAPPRTFALAMALIYESSEEALASMPQ